MSHKKLSNSNQSNFNYKSFQDVFTSNFHHKYSFSDFLSFNVLENIEKYNLKNRTIFKPTQKLKTFQRFLNTCIFEFANVNSNVVYSYRKGKSTLDAVRQHANNKYFFKTDIANFFESIDKVQIKKLLNENLDNVPIKDISDYQNRLFELVTIDGILPVGFSTSPLISNSCLFNFDNELAQFCEQHELIYTRYSDDIIISTCSKTGLESIDDVVVLLLEKHFYGKLTLNSAKTKFTHKGNKLKFLGLVVLPTGRVTVDGSTKKRIESLIHFYINDKSRFLSAVGGNYEAGLTSISGQLNYINMIDSEYLNKLRRKYGNAIVDMFFHKSVR